jgi:hypothetical protein
LRILPSQDYGTRQPFRDGTYKRISDILFMARNERINFGLEMPEMLILILQICFLRSIRKAAERFGLLHGK